MGAAIEDLIEELELRSMDGLDVEVGGIWFAQVNPPESEAIGLAFAVFVLIAVLGSVVAMGATVGAALVTVGIGAAGIVVFSNLMTVPDFAPAIGIMIGLGVGIDYALFIITRYRDALGKGLASEQAMVVALDSAGRSVIFAGATVVVSLLGMLFHRDPVRERLRHRRCSHRGHCDGRLGHAAARARRLARRPDHHHPRPRHGRGSAVQRGACSVSGPASSRCSSAPCLSPSSCWWRGSSAGRGTRCAES